MLIKIITSGKKFNIQLTRCMGCIFKRLHIQRLPFQWLHTQSMHIKRLHIQWLHIQQLHTQSMHIQRLHIQRLYIQKLSYSKGCTFRKVAQLFQTNFTKVQVKRNLNLHLQLARLAPLRPSTAPSLDHLEFPFLSRQADDHEMKPPRSILR